LHSAGITLPDHETANGSYFDAVTSAVALPDRLPAPLRAALLTLENAASAQNQDLMDQSIARRIPCVAVNLECAIDRALELWFLVPDELDQFQPAAAAESVQCPVFSIQSTLTAPPSPASLSTISSPTIYSIARTDAETFAALARLSPAEYDRARRAEAKRLDLRIETLDTEVAKCRAELNLESQANAVQLPAIEPWPEPVCGAEALDQVASRYSLYLVLPPGAADAMSLWSAHTHALDAFHLSPRLSLYSPKPGCGKTTAFDVLTTMLPRPLRTENISPAVLFRLVDQHQPALLLDEVDAYLPQSEELRGLLNAGHKRGACAYRCEGEGKAVRAFRAFAPAALAGIGSLPATLRDRSVLIPLVPAEEGQIAARFDPLRTDIEKTLARKLARWASDNFDALAACDPPLPPGAFNRLADNWRPLFAVAQIAGGDWPARALAAFNHLTPTSVSTLSTASQIGIENQNLVLLEKIRQVFSQSRRDRMSSQQLITALLAATKRSEGGSLPPHSLTDPPTHSLSAAALARLLAPLGIRARALRIGSHRARGYQLTDFAKAFAQFLDTGPQSQGD
jgi:putative DNA primase/helicase